MQAINLTAKVEKTKIQVPILGKTGRGNRSTGWVARVVPSFIIIQVFFVDC